MNYPLWWDEAFVAVNFIRRDYLDLLRPLDYGQVCPVLFLWAELAVVKLLGFSEWSLRLFPLACSVASVPLFRYAAGRVVRGVSLAPGGRHLRRVVSPDPPCGRRQALCLRPAGGRGRPGSALDWLRRPERVGRLWTLAVIAPVVLGLSHPSVFVVGGVIVGLAPAVVRGRAAERLDRLPLPGFRHGRQLPRAVSHLHATPGRGLAGAHAGAMEGRVPAAARPVGPGPMVRDRPHRRRVRISLRGRAGASILTLAALHRRGRRDVAMPPEGDLADVPGTVRPGPRGGGDPPLPLWRGDRRLAGAGHAVPRAEHLPARGRRRPRPCWVGSASPGDGFAPCAPASPCSPGSGSPR